MAALLGNPQLIDVVDEAWARDTLPNDNIQLPEGSMMPEDADYMVGQDSKRDVKRKEKWTELAIQPS
ncbi:hypothetical protein HYH02_006838 [Chlamydomonas schloesseri]|uniref:Anaphase-promoting complex subunit 13 n=1 Tax=Chlamydomonas schloesseri TaxID=2026947 RepID=A0A836B606_9CHLO|nr:hypothetical protein HYH02_006838 [Chlamydomonas schloesseri]|eukprot:KAG2448254.1 hypothetical protein HYH02_006838 [Chlamydomonas schloesseri]